MSIPPITPLPQLSHITNIGSVPASRPSLPPGVRLLTPGSQLPPNLLATTGVPGAQILTSTNASMPSIVLSSVNSTNQISQSNLISKVKSLTPTINTTALSQTRLPVHSVPPHTPRHLFQQPSVISTQPSPLPSAPHQHQAVPRVIVPKTPKPPKPKAREKIKKEKESVVAPVVHAERSSFRDDDDINDVAAMGGVNLVEESQRILAGNAEIIGQQIRSCKDEPFLYASPLHQKINEIAKRFELSECSNDVVALISHAVEDRLKTLVEKLGVIAEHRQEQLKNNPNYEIIQDVKGQAQFLQELDRIEKRRHEEQEREVLIKAAKSRSKVDDPDHIAIKARAKEMQRLEMEEIRQREANETALQAIGFPKKRLKTSIGNTASPLSTLGSLGTINNPSNNADSFSNSPANLQNIFSTSSKSFKRIKRVTIKDVLFVLERDRSSVRSTSLFKTYAR
ncbi:Transcription initiation factor TFIID subunit 4 [Sarcoptes scabiei]|nr:Transcription initiation factor TFIID subunit 4 [Sarcoptes scabiei]